MKKILLILVFSSIVVSGYSQGDLSFYQLRDIVPQTQSLNPAYTPQNGFMFSIPALNSSFNTQLDFPASDLFVQQENGNLKADFDNLLSNTNEENNFGLDFTSNLFHIQFKPGNGSLSFFSNARGSLNLQYDDDLIYLLAKGNGDAFGQTISLNENLNLMTFNEYGVGYSRSFFSEKLTLGIRAKYLNGQFYGGTNELGQLDIYTDPSSYEVTISSQNLGVQTAGLDMLINPDDYESSALGNYVTWTDNTGFAMDFGATYKLNKFTFELSFTDIGSITWRDMVINYSLNDASMTIGAQELIDDEDSEEASGFDKIADDLETFFDANEDYNTFTTKLNMKTYVGATYMLADQHRLGFTMYNNSVFNTFDPSYAASYNWLPGRKTTIGLMGSFGGMIREPQLGANLASNLGPIQFYAASNNILALTKPENATVVDVRFGFNIMLGYNKSNK